jgi:hypothetical protein
MQESSANAYIPELETGMSAWGRFEFRPVTSGLPLSTDILKGRWHVSNVPKTEVAFTSFNQLVGTGK